MPDTKHKILDGGQYVVISAPSFFSAFELDSNGRTSFKFLGLSGNYTRVQEADMPGRTGNILLSSTHKDPEFVAWKAAQKERAYSIILRAFPEEASKGEQEDGYIYPL